MSSTLKRLGGGLLALLVVAFLVIQFVPVQRTNPPIATTPAWNSSQTQALVERGCRDCHSNETRWPLYSYVAPVSWLIAHDVDEGRAKWNYSEGRGEADEAAEQVQRGAMPLRIYLITHPEARFSPAEVQSLVDGLQATFSTRRQRR